MFWKWLRSLIAADYTYSPSTSLLCHQWSPEYSCCRDQGFSCWVSYHSAKLGPLSIFRNVGIQVEPFSETPWMTSLRAVLFSILKVTFSPVLHTLSRVHAQEGSFVTEHRAGACVISAPGRPSFRCPLSEPGVTTTHTPGTHSAGRTCYWNFYWFF